MTKRDFLLLLLPSVIVVAVAVTSLHLARLFAPHPDRTQQTIDGLTQKAEHGDFGPSPDRLVGLVTDSWHGRDDLQATTTREYAVIGSALFIAVVLQLDIIFRVRGRMSNQVLEPTTGRRTERLKDEL